MKNRTTATAMAPFEDQGREPETTAEIISFAKGHLLLNKLPRLVDSAIQKATRYLLENQYQEGYWWAELESNATITAQYMMLLFLLDQLDAERQRRMVRYLYGQQADNGSWGLYYGDGGELSTTIEAYFALKLAGEDPQCEAMRRARRFILQRGGIDKARVFTKIWLALFGQFDWEKVPSMPVEIVLLPAWFPFNIYEFSSWARSTVVPLSITMAKRPSIRVPDHLGIGELYAENDPNGKCVPTPLQKLFYWIDRFLKVYENHPLPFLRRRAIQAGERWVLAHQEETGDWGGIQPPMVYGIIALHQLGYGIDHPAVAKGLEALERFCIEDERGLSLQACVSPVWDTALNCLALYNAGVNVNHPALVRAAGWLMDQQILTGGDWQLKNKEEPGGWAFEFVNSFYPDVDDSAVVLLALKRLNVDATARGKACLERGMRWCLSMQSSCGGWAAFDRDNIKEYLNKIPFADQGAMVDDPTADVTGRVLEAMAAFGWDRSHPRAARGIAFLRKLQERGRSGQLRGAWWGRWGVNYIYGTWSVLRGLIAIGEDPCQPYIRDAVRWLKEHQNEDGGWGEGCASYADPALAGRGPSTASQTAWALLGLLTADGPDSDAVRRGIHYLLDTQTAEGTWEEREFTGTGFPNHFYIRYHNYRHCFPLMALGQYRRAVTASPVEGSNG